MYKGLLRIVNIISCIDLHCVFNIIMYLGLQTIKLFVLPNSQSHECTNKNNQSFIRACNLLVTCAGLLSKLCLFINFLIFFRVGNFLVTIKSPKFSSKMLTSIFVHLVRNAINENIPVL